MEQRPKAVAVVATFLFAATAIAAVVGTALLFPGKLLNWLSELNQQGMLVFEKVGRFAGVLLLGLAVGTASAAGGLLRARKWAWWFAVGLFAINGGGDLVSFWVTGDAVRSASGLVVCSAFLYVLCRRRTRLYFQKAR